MLDKPFSRRQFLAGAAMATAAGMTPSFIGKAQAESMRAQPLYPFKLNPLPYKSDALAPVIDAETMLLHHDKHHQAYIDKLNAALENYAELHRTPLARLLADLDNLDESIRTTVRNNGGGHANHSMFWEIMGPPDSTKPKGALADAIKAQYGSLETFYDAFEKAGTGQFGSGWVFLSYDPAAKKLAIEALPNQDSPLMSGKQPLFGNDVWEHAYYLNYRNKRADYLKAWWKVLNWDAVESRFVRAQNNTLWY
jgi:Fe-Mn family superoxide dismutase